MGDGTRGTNIGRLHQARTTQLFFSARVPSRGRSCRNMNRRSKSNNSILPGFFTGDVAQMAIVDPATQPHHIVYTPGNATKAARGLRSVSASPHLHKIRKKKTSLWPVVSGSTQDGFPGRGEGPEPARLPAKTWRCDGPGGRKTRASEAVPDSPCMTSSKSLPHPN